jgi:hypothetical protein
MIQSLFVSVRYTGYQSTFRPNRFTLGDSLLIEHEFEWAPKSVCTFCKRQNSLVRIENLTTIPLSISPYLSHGMECHIPAATYLRTRIMEVLESVNLVRGI